MLWLVIGDLKPINLRLKGLRKFRIKKVKRIKRILWKIGILLILNKKFWGWDSVIIRILISWIKIVKLNRIIKINLL